MLTRGAQLAFELERLDNLGIWVLTRADAAYPNRLKERLGATAPPVLFGAGDQTLLTRGFLAVVGSRDVDEAGAAFARQVGETCAQGKLVVVSGGAKGVDRLSMFGALNAGGSAIGVLADSLERTVREPEYRTAAAAGRLTLVSVVHPRTSFNVANAMARNKLIYCMAQYGLVVSASQEKGGTRAGALEVLKQRWVPLFVRSGKAAPAGNRDLIELGALELDSPLPPDGLAGWLQEHAAAWTQIAAATARRSLREAGRMKAGPKRTAAVNLPVMGDDLFPLAWPHIAQRLGKWPTAAELAPHLQVERVQLEVWLNRASEAGLVVYEPATKQYSLVSEAGTGAQTRLSL